MTMIQHLSVSATGLFQHVAEDRQAVHRAFLVDRTGERNQCRGARRQAMNQRAEGIAEDAAEQPGLCWPVNKLSRGPVEVRFNVAGAATYRKCSEIGRSNEPVRSEERRVGKECRTR